MIAFWTTRRNAYPVSAYRAATLRSQVERACLHFFYEDWLDQRPEHWQHLTSALHIFSDIEFLSAHEANRAAALHGVLSGAGSRVLNHPHRSLKRLALHQKLRADGINQFRSFAVDEVDPRVLRFPVFLRAANDHLGARSGLLKNAAELAEAIASSRAQIERDGDWIVSEYCETADASGLRHKFAAFNIGGVIIPKHWFFSNAWSIKDPELDSPALLARERDYLETNPHRAWLADVFARAGIEYGRIDYSLVGEQLQVWEINTNPMVFRQGQWWSNRAAHHRLVNRAVERAWQSLDALQPVRGRWQWQRLRAFPAVAESLARESVKHALSRRRAWWRALRRLGRAG